MNILTIDTATAVEMVAASSGSKVSDETREVGVSHSITLFESMDNALNELGIAIKDIDLVGVGIGPGSFTGIRIAVTTARMLAQLLGAPLVGIKTHLFYAASVKADIDDNILIAFDAKKGRVFGALYRRGPQELSPVEIVEPGDYYMDFLINQIDKENRTFIIGDGVEKYYDSIKSEISDHELLTGFKPSAKIACDMTGNIYKIDSGLYASINRVVPFYSRKSDAEIVKESRNKR